MRATFGVGFVVDTMSPHTVQYRRDERSKMRTWVVGIVIGACVLTSSCKEGGTIPGHQPSTNSPGVKIQPKGEGLLKPFDFTYDCLTNGKLGKAEVQRCREQLELAESDRKKGVE